MLAAGAAVVRLLCGCLQGEGGESTDSLQLLLHSSCSSHFPGDVTSLEQQKDFGECKSDWNVINNAKFIDRRKIWRGV